MFLYCWHDRRYHAIKVGLGLDPSSRMRDYAVACSLNPDPISLRCYAIPRGWRVGAVENLCHGSLRDELCLKNVGKLKELFLLDYLTYHHVADHVIASMIRHEANLHRQM